MSTVVYTAESDAEIDDDIEDGPIKDTLIRIVCIQQIPEYDYYSLTYVANDMFYSNLIS